MRNNLHVFILAILLFHCSVQANAQTENTYQDTVSEYEDTDGNYYSSSKHIYDTSALLFNQKESVNTAYTDVLLQPHASADSAVEKLRNEDDFWYVKSIEKFKTDAVRLRTDKAYRDSLIKEGILQPDEQVFSQEQNASFLFQPWVTAVIWCIIIGIFLFAVVYFLLSNKINFFSRNAATVNTDGNVEENVNIFQLPYSELLQKAYAEKNYRLAVRILYLQTLKLLSEKNVINFQPDFTNMHYLQQLLQTKYYNDFFAITRHYEYVWYGKFNVSEPAFERIKTDFNAIQNKVIH